MFWSRVLLRVARLPIRYIVLLVVGGQTAVHLGLSLTAGHVGESALATAQIVNGDVRRLGRVAAPDGRPVRPTPR